MREIDMSAVTTITLGRLGENRAAVIRFHCEDWEDTYGVGTFGLVAKHDEDSTAHPCAITVEDGVVSWEITSQETQKKGYGRCELFYTVGGVVAKSDIYRTYVADALTGGETPPEPYDDWLVQAVEAAGDAEAAKQGAIAAKQETQALFPAGGTAGQVLTKTADGTEWADAQGGGTDDHTQLINRDAADQHPISAVTGLQSALNGKIAEPVSEGSPGQVLGTDGEGGRQWITVSGGGGTSDHTALSNRDAANQHPIGAVTGLQSKLDGLDTTDTNLQEQIDALSSKSDVVDVVADHAELLSYDTSDLLNNDVVKVLEDETQSNAISYYRWTISGASGSWNYIGSQGPFYTKAESNTLLGGKQDTISDLATIRSGAALGATALQSVPNTYRTAAEQDTIDAVLAGATIFKITCTESGGTKSFDKTYAEITAAITAGKLPVVTFSGRKYVFGNSEFSKYWFYSIETNQNKIYNLNIDSSNTVSDGTLTTVAQGHGHSQSDISGLSTALAGKLAASSVAHETWTFTLEDDTAVTKEVVTWTGA